VRSKLKMFKVCKSQLLAWAIFCLHAAMHMPSGSVTVLQYDVCETTVHMQLVNCSEV